MDIRAIVCKTHPCLVLSVTVPFAPILAMSIKPGVVLTVPMTPIE